MDYKDIYDAFSKLPRAVLNLLILDLMREGIISFSELANLNTQYLEELRKAETERLMALRAKVIGLWCGTKRDLPTNLCNLIQEGMEEGWVNITQEKIDKSKWKKPLPH